MNLANTRGDTIRVTSESTGTITVNSIIGVDPDEITDVDTPIQVLRRDSLSRIVLALSDELIQAMSRPANMNKFYDEATDSFYVTPESYIGTLGVKLNDERDSIVFGRTGALDTLAQINQYATSSSKYFTFTDATEIYTPIASTGTTGLTGRMYVVGVADGNNKSTVDYTNTYSGFDVQQYARLIISDVTFTRAVSDKEGAIIVNNGDLTLTNVSFTSSNVNSTEADIKGGILSNNKDLTDISVTFSDNKALTTDYNILGSAMYTKGSIDSMSGNFIGNYGYGGNCIFPSYSLVRCGKSSDFILVSAYGINPHLVEDLVYRIHIE